MTDIFDQEGITFSHANMASTHPTTTPKAIPVPPVAVSELTKKVQSSGPVPLPPAPQDIAAKTLAGTGSDGVEAAAGAAPPQPQAPSFDDIFDKEGIDVTQAPSGANAFTRGVYLPSATNPQGIDPEIAQVTSYVDHQQQQAHQLAAQRFTPEQLNSFANNPVSMAEAIQNQQDWPDVPVLLEKQASGEALDDAQKNRLNEYVDTVLAHNVRGMSWNGNKAVTGAQLPASAISYIKSGAAGALPVEVQEQVKPNLGGNAIVPPPYTPKTGETALNDFAAVTDKGKQIMATAKDKPASTALKAAAYISQDAAAAPSQVKTPLISNINDLPASLRSALFDAYKQHDPKAQMSKMMTPQGWAKAIDTIGEDEAAKILHWYTPMTFDEHREAQYTGGVIPISVDKSGNNRFDPRAGVLSFLMAPGDVATGKIQPGTPEFEEAAMNVAMGIMTGDVGAKAVGKVAGASEKAAGEVAAKSGVEVAQASAKPTTPPTAANVDRYMDAVSPAKDQMMVDAGMVSVDGAKSTATKAAENILQDKGLTPEQAQEVSANMTANEKDQFVTQNVKQPQGTYQTADEIMASGEPVHADMEAQASADPATAIGESQIKAANAKEPPPINDEESGYNWLTQKASYLYRRFVNVLQPLENAEAKAAERGLKLEPGQSPKMLSNLYGNVGAMINHYLSVETFRWMPDGSTEVTGKALKAIMDDFDNLAMRFEKSRDARFKDFNDYLLAQRYLELEKAGEGKAKPQQIEWSNKRLGELSEKYGEDLHLVENLAQEVYGFQRRTLDMLVDAQVISPETRDMLNKKYQRYIPLNRVFEEGEKQSSGNGKYLGKFSGAGAQGVIMKLRGSEREVREPLLNIFERTHKAVDRAYRNRVTNSVKGLMDVMPEYIQFEQPRIIKKGKAEVRIVHDPILDKKLDTAIEYFGHKFQRESSIKVKGYKNVLGSYDPMEKIIRAKLGANEAVKTHEVGHMLDYELNLGAKLLKDPEIKAQLQKLAEERIGSNVSMAHNEEGVQMMQARQSAGEKYVKYIKNDREVIANMYDAYVNAPELLDKIAPKAKAAFEEMIAGKPELSFIKDIKPSLNRAERVIEKDVWGEAPELPPNTLEGYANGERYLLRVAKPMYEAATQLGPARVGMLEKLLRGTFGLSARILRTGATSTVSFIERNVFRDQMDAMIQGGVAYNPPWDFSKGLFAAFGKTELYNSWVRAGGKMHFMELGDTAMEKAYKEMLNGEGRFKQLLEAAPRFSEKFEQATRIGLFNAAKRAGKSDLEASLMSLEGTLNFGRGGDVIKKLNQYIPFLNAGVQATDKLIRTAYNNPKLTLAWGIGTVTIPTIAITGYYLHAADEQTRREYLEIPQWQKDMFWTVKIDGEWRSFPKPFSWGYMFGSLPERVMLHGYYQGRDDGRDMWEGMMKGLFGTLSPVNDWSAAMPPLLKVVAEWQSNYNFFMDRNIYPTWMEDLPPEQRKNAYTSQTAQLMGKATGQSPALIENSIRDLTGGVGGYALKAGDALIDQVHKWEGHDVAKKPISDADNILLQGFTIRDPIGSNSNSVQTFFKNYDKSKQAYMGQKNIPDEEKDAYVTQNQAQIDSFKFMSKAHKSLARLQKEAARIYKDTTMSSEDKTAQLKELNGQITEVAYQANLQYNAAAKTSKGERK